MRSTIRSTDICHSFMATTDHHQYLPIDFTCAENDAVVSIGLRHGTVAAFLRADDGLRYLTRVP